MRELGSNAPGLSTHLVCLHCVTTNYAVLPDLRIELEQVICCYHMLYRRAAITSIWCVRCPCWRRPHCCTGLAWRHIPKYAWGCAPQPRRLTCVSIKTGVGGRAKNKGLVLHREYDVVEEVFLCCCGFALAACFPIDASQVGGACSRLSK